MALDSVKILYKGGTAEIEVKKSRFIANLKPVESEEDARALIVGGFAEPIAKELPVEYAVEMNNLIHLEMKGSIG